MEFKSLKENLRRKIDSWKEKENSIIKDNAIKLVYHSAINLAGKVEKPLKKQLAEIVLNKNVEFYLTTATIQRAQEMSFMDYLKYEIYSFLDKKI